MALLWLIQAEQFFYSQIVIMSEFNYWEIYFLLFFNSVFNVIRRKTQNNQNEIRLEGGGM